ncbi:hypothetical protein H257_11805 [Aphanomyces astaci]|uniref:HTH CENPB-type domain-containing protein n=1 Tax=Aphanomyces astaci TaxID=112090 RepID=W4G2J1_APHAT|nr:hypothetical protein H257_11805 [Aphanomyces astaci]ETV73264.1 hypothetical protein H257_11805 [Aphanomyces astaci]|eukprot:XP_009837139.1 hypothetical protein H257_11805 [Aphanomyces astaci]
MPPTRERGKYSKDLLHTAVQAVINRSKAPEVAKRHNIPIATLNKRVREQRSGQALVTKRRGPKPTLPDSCEEDLVAWIVAMQRDGNPTDRKTIIVKANQVLRRLDPTASLSAGWYRRFIVRHPQLTNRVAQVISSARNEVDDVAVTTLFNSLVNAIVTNKLSSDRVFNMDETSFSSRRKSKDFFDGIQRLTFALTNFHLGLMPLREDDQHQYRSVLARYARMAEEKRTARAATQRRYAQRRAERLATDMLRSSFAARAPFMSPSGRR